MKNKAIAVLPGKPFKNASALVSKVPRRRFLGKLASGIIVLGSTSLILKPRKVHAAAPASDYNFAGCVHQFACIALNKSNVAIHSGAGIPLGLYVNNKANSSCSGSRLRFQVQEGVVAGTRDYYYSWGLDGVDGQSGHIWIADMVSRPTIVPSTKGMSGGLYNGRSAPDIILGDGVTKKSYWIKPVSIPGEMRYIGPNDGLWHSFQHYGTPAQPYSYGHTPLCWSWVNVGGGGIVRSQMKLDEVFYPSDVATINITSKDQNTGAPNGTVKAMYGSFWNGSQRLYGWTVHSHTYPYGGTYYEHIACRTC